MAEHVVSKAKKVIIEASQLSWWLSSDFVYFLDGVIDLTWLWISIEVPAWGLYLSWHNFDLSWLVCNDANYTMFTSPVWGSWNLVWDNLQIEVSGSNSQVFDISSLTWFEALELIAINYNNCTSLGSIDSYRQLLESWTGRFWWTPSLTFTWTWSWWARITTSITRWLDNAMVDAIFRAGVWFTMQSRFLTDMNIDLGSTAPFIDFSDVNLPNPSTLQIQGAIVSRNGVFDPMDSTISPNIDHTNTSSIWAGNKWLFNTTMWWLINIDAEVTTNITSSNTFVDLNWTFSASNLQHFDSPSQWQLRNIWDPLEISISWQLILESNQNNDVSLKIVIWRDATSMFEDWRIITRTINNLQWGRDVWYFNISSNTVFLNQNDYIKLQVANLTWSWNITAELDSFYVIEKR